MEHNSIPFAEFQETQFVPQEQPEMSVDHINQVLVVQVSTGEEQSRENALPPPTNNVTSEDWRLSHISKML